MTINASPYVTQIDILRGQRCEAHDEDLDPVLFSMSGQLDARIKPLVEQIDDEVDHGT
jgi:hypothetical protein